MPLELGGPALAHPLRRRRAQVELGERRAQVEARAADDDRPPALREQPVDLGVGELRVLADAERRVDRQEGDEAVLERRALGRRGDAGEGLEARRPAARRPRRRRDPRRARAAVSARATATAVLPTPVGPNSAMIRMRVGSQLVQISGSTVLLTGATGGIGHAIARALGARGAKLILTGRRIDVLEPLASELGGRALAVDLSRPGGRSARSREAGEVDILVANAALPAAGHAGVVLGRGDRPRARRQPARPDRPRARARPGDGQRGSGHLLFMSSLAGKAATPGTALYNATKFGLRGFASALRGDLRTSGVGVSPSSPASSATRACSPTPASSFRRASARARPEDVARPRSRRSSATAARSTSPPCPCAPARSSRASPRSSPASVARQLGSERDRTRNGGRPARQALSRGRPPSPGRAKKSVS